MLLARVSSTGFSAAGTWTLPGGGIDHGEHPEDSLRREVHEETGLTIEVRRILGVVSRHFTGPSPRGEIEDFHGLHLVYDAEVSSPSDEPRVVEVDGTTDAVAWLRVGRRPGRPGESRCRRHRGARLDGLRRVLERVASSPVILIT